MITANEIKIKNIRHKMSDETLKFVDYIFSLLEEAIEEAPMSAYIIEGHEVAKNLNFKDSYYFADIFELHGFYLYTVNDVLIISINRRSDLEKKMEEQDRVD